MMPDEQDRFFGIITRALGEYVREPSEGEFESWWAVCRHYPLDDVKAALKAHELDPDDGKRAPRPIDIKRRLYRPSAPEPDQRAREPVDSNSVSFIEQVKREARSPSVVNTAHAIALRHGNRPWWPDANRYGLPPRRQREPGEEG